MKLLIKIILLITVAFIIYFIFPRDTDNLIFIPSDKDELYSAIEKQNIPLNSFDTFILSLYDLKAGWIRLKEKTIDKYSLIKKIKESKTREKTRKMVMYSGATIENFLIDISKQAKLNRSLLAKKYKELSYFKEGDIVAKKYNIPFNTTESSTIAYMIYTSHNLYKKLAKKYGVKFPSQEFKKHLIIASIIAKETANKKEMKLISAVIHNRLKKGMKLQLDATLNYGKQSHTIVTHNLIQSDHSQYNTYKHKGLPPSAICSPSIDALEASFNPAKVSYIYFVKNGNVHTFSNEYKSHLKKVAHYKQNLANKKLITKIINKPIKINFPILMPKLNINRLLNTFKP